jgi:hypothetical protein
LAYELYGERGTLVRPTTLIGKNAWSVELDRGGFGPFRRTRIVESALRPEAEALVVLASSWRRRRATARWMLGSAPMFVLWWFYLPWPAALTIDVVILAAVQLGYWMTSARRTGQ